MTLRLNDSKGTSEIEIQAVEVKTGLSLPKELLHFLIQYSGGNSYNDDVKSFIDYAHQDDGWTSTFEIESVLMPDQIIEVHQNLKDYLQDLVEDFEIPKSDVEVHFLLPFISTSSGTILMASGGKHEGKIFVADNGDFGLMKLADSLVEFLNSLYLFDTWKGKRV